MNILEGLEQADACLGKIHVSGEDVFQLANARQLLKAVYEAIKPQRGAGAPDKSDKEE